MHNANFTSGAKDASAATQTRLVLEVEKDPLTSGSATRWRARRALTPAEFDCLVAAEATDRAAQQNLAAAIETALQTRALHARVACHPPGIMPTAQKVESAEERAAPEATAAPVNTAAPVITAAQMATAAPVAKATPMTTAVLAEPRADKVPEVVWTAPGIDFIKSNGMFQGFG